MLFVLAGTHFGKRPVSRRRALIATVGALSTLLIFSAPWTANRLILMLEQGVVSSFDPSVPYDAVVVLGGMSDIAATRQSGRPAFNEDVERVLVAYDVLQSGDAKFAVLSGGPDSSGVTDAEVARDQLLRLGVDAERLLLEPRAMNTRENATYVAALAKERGLQRLVIVTTAYHMIRARECFRAVDLEVDTLPVDFRGGGRKGFLPRSHALDQSSRAIREGVGRWIYRWMGYARR